MTEDTLISINDLHKSFSAVEVLRGVDFTVGRNETVAIIGPSGAGKSTVLRCLNLLEEWDTGSIRFDGIDLGRTVEDGVVKKWRSKQKKLLRREIGMVFQHFNLFPHMNVLDNVLVGPRKIKKLPRIQAEEIAKDLLDQVGLGDKLKSNPRELSGGQQQRVAIARALAMRPKVMLLDEITSALDPELIGEVLEVVRRLRQHGMTMLLVTHEIQFAAEVADKIVFMEDGRVTDHGTPQQVVYDPQSDRIKRFLSRFRGLTSYAGCAI